MPLLLPINYVDRMGIEPVIRVRKKNSSTKANRCMSRKMVVIDSLEIGNGGIKNMNIA